MEERLYTVQEANELLPFLAPTLVELREKFEEAAHIKRKMATASRSNGWSTARDEWTSKLARVDELLKGRIGQGAAVEEAAHAGVRAGIARLALADCDLDRRHGGAV